MADGKRPGGLTALAVLNFIFGGLSALGAVGMLGLAALAAEAKRAVESAGGTTTYDGPGVMLFYVVMIMMAVSAFLLIASGVGYIKMKRFMGRTLGTAYALLSIGSTVINLVMLKSGFGVGTIIGLIYPVLTLILLNSTFKDDLVN